MTKGQLWLTRAWSRPVRWGREVDTVMRYVARNAMKATCFDDFDTFEIVDGFLRSPEVGVEG